MINLPIEIWDMILSWLSDIHDVSSIHQVCRLFHLICPKSIRRLSSDLPRMVDFNRVLKFSNIEIIDDSLLLVHGSSDRLSVEDLLPKLVKANFYLINDVDIYLPACSNIDFKILTYRNLSIFHDSRFMMIDLDQGHNLDCINTTLIANPHISFYSHAPLPSDFIYRHRCYGIIHPDSGDNSFVVSSKVPQVMLKRCKEILPRLKTKLSTEDLRTLIQGGVISVDALYEIFFEHMLSIACESKTTKYDISDFRRDFFPGEVKNTEFLLELVHLCLVDRCQSIDLDQHLGQHLGQYEVPDTEISNTEYNSIMVKLGSPWLQVSCLK